LDASKGVIGASLLLLYFLRIESINPFSVLFCPALKLLKDSVFFESSISLVIFGSDDNLGTEELEELKSSKGPVGEPVLDGKLSKGVAGIFVLDGKFSKGFVLDCKFSKGFEPDAPEDGVNLFAAIIPVAAFFNDGPCGCIGNSEKRFDEPDALVELLDAPEGFCVNPPSARETVFNDGPCGCIGNSEKGFDEPDALVELLDAPEGVNLFAASIPVAAFFKDGVPANGNTPKLLELEELKLELEEVLGAPEVNESIFLSKTFNKSVIRFISDSGIFLSFKSIEFIKSNASFASDIKFSANCMSSIRC
jgi:hypothetical protein